MKRKNTCSDFCLFQTGRNFLWKKFLFLLMCAFLGSLPTIAQTRKVGDPIVKDGVPCVIIQVYDEAGNHVLAMSLPAKSKAIKTAQKTGEKKWFYSPKKLKGSAKKLQQEYLTEYYNRTKCDSLKIQTSNISAPTRPSTSHSGKENMKNVIDYCNEKGIEMEMYFPEYAWAQNLGEGWFIPGVNEWESFIKLLGYNGLRNRTGILKDQTPSFHKNLKNAISALAENGDDIYFKDVELVFNWYLGSLLSSTIINIKKYTGPASLIKYPTLGVYVMKNVKGKFVCAVCEF